MAMDKALNLLKAFKLYEFFMHFDVLKFLILRTGLFVVQTMFLRYEFTQRQTHVHDNVPNIQVCERKFASFFPYTIVHKNLKSICDLKKKKTKDFHLIPSIKRLTISFGKLKLVRFHFPCFEHRTKQSHTHTHNTKRKTKYSASWNRFNFDFSASASRRLLPNRNIKETNISSLLLPFARRTPNTDGNLRNDLFYLFIYFLFPENKCVYMFLSIQCVIISDLIHKPRQTIHHRIKCFVENVMSISIRANAIIYAL